MAVKERTRVSKEVVEKAFKELMKYEEKHGFKRGELKIQLEKIADKHGISWHSLKNRYYRDSKVETPKAETKAKVETPKAETKAKEQTLIDEVIKKQDKLKAALESHSNNENNQDKEEKPKFTIELTESGRKKKILTENPYATFIDIDKKIEESSRIPAQKILHQPKDFYKAGQLVKIKVSNLQSYGAFCEIMDGRGYQGLVHISEIIEGYINKVTDYLEIDEIIENAKIIMIDNKRINITLKHLNLSQKHQRIEQEEENKIVVENPPVNVIGEKFSSLKDKLMERAVVTTGNNLSEIDEIFAQELLSEGQEVILKKYERDIEQMTSYLQVELGALSQPAKLLLAKMIDEQGVFNTTRGIIETQKNFQADIGLLFMQMMKSKFGEYL